MSTLLAGHQSGDAERLAGDALYCQIKVRKEQAVSFEQALVAHQVLVGRGPPPAWVVTHPCVRAEPSHRHALDDDRRGGIAQRRSDRRPVGPHELNYHVTTV